MSIYVYRARALEQTLSINKCLFFRISYLHSALFATVLEDTLIKLAILGKHLKLSQNLIRAENMNSITKAKKHI